MAAGAGLRCRCRRGDSHHHGPFAQPGRCGRCVLSADCYGSRFRPGIDREMAANAAVHHLRQLHATTGGHHTRSADIFGQLRHHRHQSRWRGFQFPVVQRFTGAADGNPVRGPRREPGHHHHCQRHLLHYARGAGAQHRGTTRGPGDRASHDARRPWNPDRRDSGIGVERGEVRDHSAGHQKFGLGSLPVPFDVRDPLSIASATPNTLDAGGPAFVMTVNGTGFVSGLTVTWAGQPMGTTFVSPTQLQAAITQQTRSLSGTFNLRVGNPPGAPSNEYPVTVSPVLFGIIPAAAAAGGSAVAITATGAGFTRNSSLLLVGAGQQTALATTYVNVTTLTAVVPASALRFAGAATVQVVDSTGPGHSLAQPFAITEAVPSIAGISPSGATAGAVAFALTVNGGNFVAGATVQWNGSALATTFRNATQLSAAVPAALVQAAGLSGIGVSNPGGTQSANLTFTVNPPAPVIASLSPSSASTGAAGFSMT